MIDTTEQVYFQKSKIISTQQYFNIFYKNKVPPIELLPQYKPPNELVIMVFNRKLCLRDQNERLFKKYEPVLFGVQFPILATEKTSRRELYEMVWLRVRSQLKLSCYDRENLWWNRTDELPATSPSASRNDPVKPLTPFVLKHVDMIGVSCSLCHWSKRCHGCPILPTVDDSRDL